MNIKTKEFQLTKGEYFNIITLKYFKRKWWLFILLFLIAGLLWLLGRFYIALFIFVFTVIYPIFLIVFFWIYSNSKKNKIFYTKRFYEVDNEFLSAYLEDGSLQKTKLDNIIKVVKTSKYYLLYISITQFFYIPFSAFNNAEELKSFDELLKK
ncbi:MAG: hypothetical protein E3J87_09290 [Candidatus Cloacimonadota bacterium]|nr:MAG: hypothetical protein E3J87_09290 [Candidatus Cloacimonadota bacterium]